MVGILETQINASTKRRSNNIQENGKAAQLKPKIKVGKTKRKKERRPFKI